MPHTSLWIFVLRVVGFVCLWVVKCKTLEFCANSSPNTEDEECSFPRGDSAQLNVQGHFQVHSVAVDF